MHPRDVAKLACGNLKKRLGARSRRRLKPGLRLNCRGYFLCESLPRCERHIETPGKEAFKHLEVGTRKLGNAMIRKRETGMRLRYRNRRREEVGGEGSRRFDTCRRFFQAIAHNQRSRGKVA